MEGKEISKRQRALKEIGKVLVNFGNLTFAMQFGYAELLRSFAKNQITVFITIF
jgi:hypothetical protein